MPRHDEERARLERGLANLRKQHLWGDLSDEEYRQERQTLERQLKALSPAGKEVPIPNLERAAQLLGQLPALWEHLGVSDKQREEFIREVFTQVRLRGENLVAIEPKSVYQPMFAYLVARGVRKSRGEWI